VDNFNEDIK